jgi:hypothetical protein
MLSNTGYSNYRSLDFFWTEREQEDVDRTQETFSQSPKIN